MQTYSKFFLWENGGYPVVDKIEIKLFAHAAYTLQSLAIF
jgi:hypothetical protein